MLALPILCVSLDRTASAPLRGALAFSASDVPAALLGARVDAGVRRLAILSTCHRIELYADASEGPGAPLASRLIDWLAATKGVPAAEVKAAARVFEGEAAAQHLYRVAAGLEAALLGEAEILDQVRAACKTSVVAHAASPAMKALFRGAIRTAERARAVAWRSFRRVDIGSIACDAAEAARGRLDDKRLLLLGAGRVGALAGSAACARNARVTVWNRSPERGRELAARLGVVWAMPAERVSAIDNADAIIVATSAAAWTLDATEVQASMARRPRDLVVVDTAMPRNAEPAIHDVAGATLVDLDELLARTRLAHGEREAAVPQVEQLIEAALGSLRARSWPAAMSRPAGRFDLATELV